MLPTEPFLKKSDPAETAGCTICPRACGALRTAANPGLCGSDEGFDEFRVARLMAHHWEEPFISGQKGSGTVFFSGCSLGCCFCQNEPISQHHAGDRLTSRELSEAVFQLLESGVHNLSLVTPSHYADRIPAWFDQLSRSRPWQDRPVPLIWNSSAYETVESLRPLGGSVAIYLPDMKFCDAALADSLAGAPDYAGIALPAIREMLRQQPDAHFDDAGLLLHGVVLRHLVLPGHWRDSCAILTELARFVPPDTPLSLMSQYTPQTGNRRMLQLPANTRPELMRRLTTWEYRQVLDCALDLGFRRILGQERSSADSAYTPDFTERFRPGRT